MQIVFWGVQNYFAQLQERFLKRKRKVKAKGRRKTWK